MLDFDAVRKAIDGCTVVIHCAAIAGVYTVDRSAVRTMEVNLLGTHQVVKAAIEVGVERFVEFSTSEVYGAVHPQGQGRRLHADRPDRREPLGLRRQQARVGAPVVRALPRRQAAAGDRAAVQRLRPAPGRRRRDPRHDAAGAARTCRSRSTTTARRFARGASSSDFVDGVLRCCGEPGGDRPRLQHRQSAGHRHQLRAREPDHPPDQLEVGDRVQAAPRSRKSSCACRRSRRR